MMTEQFETFSREELYSMLEDGLVSVFFNKVDGTPRHMKCSWSDIYVPSDERLKTPFKEETEEEKQKRLNRPSVPVWDIEARGWRSFRLDSVYRINNKVCKYAGDPDAGKE